MKKYPGYITNVPNCFSKYQINAKNINVLKINELVINVKTPIIVVASIKNIEIRMTLPNP